MADAASADAPARPRVILRHSFVVRVAHWVNVLCLTILLMSGLQIFNAHPALYFGDQSNFDHPVLSIGAGEINGRGIGVTTVFGHSFATTGVLGLSNDRGDLTERAFPSWITIPTDQDLATGRRWHFLFAWLFVLNGLAYLFYGLIGGHFRRDLVPSRAEFGGLGATILHHLKLKFPHGEEARRYNVLQMMTYLGVVFILLPLVAVAGWSMSPGLDSAFPWLPEMFGGRQSARSIHFIAATFIVLFVVVHVLMVLVSGVWNNLRSMITGRYALK